MQEDKDGSTTAAPIGRLFNRYRHPIWLGLSIVGIGVMAYLLLNIAGLGSDAVSYWRLDVGHLYDNAVGNLSAPIAFRYAPPIALMFAPAGLLPLQAFVVLWLGIQFAALVYLTRWWALAWVAFYPVALELGVGNIHLVLAALLVAGLRWPVAWAVLPLTKVTPVVCWVWFAVRGEWRSLALMLLATVVIGGISYLVVPSLWWEWIAMLQTQLGAPAGKSVPIPLVIRLPAAVILVAWGARTDRPWTLAVSLLLSLPTIWPQGFSILAALPALAAAGGEARARLAVAGPPTEPGVVLEAGR